MLICRLRPKVSSEGCLPGNGLPRSLVGEGGGGIIRASLFAVSLFAIRGDGGTVVGDKTRVQDLGEGNGRVFGDAGGASLSDGNICGPTFGEKAGPRVGD